MITLLVLGAVTGLVLALTGAGGGVLAVPLLVYGAEMSLLQAGPVALVAVFLAAASGALFGWKAGAVRYRAALLIGGTGILVTPLGLLLAQHLDMRWLTLLFASILMHVAYKSWRGPDAGHARTKRLPACVRDPASGRLHWTACCVRVLSLSGGLAGMLSGLLGVGGGFVVVPALRRFTDLPARSVVATSLAVVALVSFNGAALGIASGTVSWQLAAPFCTGTIGGMMTGHRLAVHLPGFVVHRLFAALAALIAAVMLLSGLP
jgi:uncharacterized membrane protein YfcA